jgi:hypothetical protein
MCGVLVDRQNHGILPYWFKQSVSSKASKTVRRYLSFKQFLILTKAKKLSIYILLTLI